MSRLTKFIETLSTLIKNQPGTQPGRQIHDSTYCLLRLSIIQYNISQNGLATYVAFCDFSTAFQSIYRGKFILLICIEIIVAECGSISGKASSRQGSILHPRISKNSSVDILRGVPEGSRLSPALFGIFVASCTHELKAQFPNAAILHDEELRWIKGKLYIDDLCIISTHAHDLQVMIINADLERKGQNAIQYWQNKSDAFSWNHTIPQCTEKTTESSATETVASIISYYLTDWCCFITS